MKYGRNSRHVPSNITAQAPRRNAEESRCYHCIVTSASCTTGSGQTGEENAGLEDGTCAKVTLHIQWYALAPLSCASDHSVLV